MSGLLFGAVVLAGALLVVRHIRHLADIPDLHDVFTDDDPERAA